MFLSALPRTRSCFISQMSYQIFGVNQCVYEISWVRINKRSSIRYIENEVGLSTSKDKVNMENNTIEILNSYINIYRNERVRFH